MKPINVGLLGIGTVGGGTWDVLSRNAGEIRRRAGRAIKITQVADKALHRARKITGKKAKVVADAFKLVRDAEIDIIVELIGGTSIAKELVLEAIRNGKHVVTANKALLATHGTEIFAAAQKNGVMVAFEGSVGGGIPIIKALREGLAANRIEWIAGIINGTSNFILSEMRDRGLDFSAALGEAQRRGYAEADPAFDIEGVDAAHKLTILSALAFGIPMQLKKCFREGIEKLTRADIGYAEELGYRIKLLGIARLTDHGLEQRVHPCMVPRATPIAHVDGVFNAVVAEGDFAGRVLLQGRGAGAEPTASAVVADLLDIAAGRRTPTFAVPAGALQNLPASPMLHHEGAYYVRLMVFDRPGVIADITAALRDEQVSLESMIQRGRAPGEAVPVVLTTHITVEAAMRRALDRIAGLDTVLEPPRMIRIEDL
jgi:homoserine dehydrogenase